MNSVFLVNSNKNKTGLWKEISIYKYTKKYTQWIEIVFVKTHKNEAQDLEGSTKLLTIHFVRMKVFAHFKCWFPSLGLWVCMRYCTKFTGRRFFKQNLPNSSHNTRSRGSCFFFFCQDECHSCWKLHFVFYLQGIIKTSSIIPFSVPSNTSNWLKSKIFFTDMPCGLSKQNHYFIDLKLMETSVKVNLNQWPTYNITPSG